MNNTPAQSMEFLGKIYLYCLTWLRKHPGENPDAERIAREIDALVKGARPGTPIDAIELLYDLLKTIRPELF